MSRDKSTEAWLASLSKEEIIDQYFLWHDAALETGRKYNAICAEKLALCKRINELCKLARQMYPYAKAHLQFGVMLGRNDTMSYDWALQMIEMGIEVPE